jgi:phosphoribosylformimino-5-aminoimidazole carboxamide ribotide isomerase
VDLYPAIDLRGGRCVRLVEGDFDRETVYGDDPVAVAVSFAESGARWIHVVDLDAARTGDPVNRAVVTRIATAVAATGVRVQTGGGVRTIADATALLSAGVARVVIGTAAVEDPDLVRRIADRWPGRVAVGLDHRNGDVRTRGWTEGGGKRVDDLVPSVLAAGASVVIVTDISRDGLMAGPDVEGLSALLEATGAAIVASGGIRDLEDVRSLASLGAAGARPLVGAIAGRAVYEGTLDVAAAVALLAEAGS